MELTWTAGELALRRPFRISRTELQRREAVVVCLRHRGIEGRGEAVASTYRRQDGTAIEASLRDLRSQVAGLSDPFAVLEVIDSLTEKDGERAASLAAVDAAAHDWIGRSRGISVRRFLGLPDRPRRTALSIGITSPDEAADLAAAAVRDGFETLKLKVGLADAPAEHELVGAVRAAAPAATLLLDANGGWGAAEATARIEALSAFGVALAEQPVQPGQPEALRAIREASPVPIFADEDATSDRDVAWLAGCVDGVNVKINECGGIRAALRMIHAARAGGLQVMLGCAVSSSLGIAPAAQLATLADHLDLDGHLHLASDPWTGLAGPCGALLTAGPGLGVVRESAEGAWP